MFWFYSSSFFSSHLVCLINPNLVLSADMFIALDKDSSQTLSKQELREYADATLTEIFIERGMDN